MPTFRIPSRSVALRTTQVRCLLSPAIPGPIVEPDISVDHVVIGAGVVGLAVAERLSRQKDATTLVLELHAAFGTETSSRNSEVIHAGIYYPPTSLKTRLCIRGKNLLYPLCEKHNIPYKRVGKWIVATDDAQIPELDKIKSRADSLGVPVHFLSQSEANAIEPNVKAVKVL
ncbi:hypothetical protein HK097_005703, partial [Rhizophlyctis rosea]